MRVDPIIRGGMVVALEVSLNGAKVLGIDADVGSIEAGKVADLVVVDANLEAVGTLHDTSIVFRHGIGWDSEKLIESIRKPSQEVSPQFTTWAPHGEGAGGDQYHINQGPLSVNPFKGDRQSGSKGLLPIIR